MKVDLEYCLICETSIIDRAGRMSIINSYDVIFAESVPAQHTKFAIVGLIRATNATETPGKIKVSIRVKTPSGKQLTANDPEVTFDVPATSKDLGIGFGIDSPLIVLPEYGEYSVIVEVDGKKLATKHFKVEPSKKK